MTKKVLEKNLFSRGRGGSRSVKYPIGHARRVLTDAEEEIYLDKNKEEITRTAVENAEESGIIFVDEIDKLAQGKSDYGNYRKGEGVQKELLSLFEGTTVKTPHGLVRTDHILFIGSGAFHNFKPTDLMPELQGRLPIRVQLDALTQDDYEKILGETQYNLLEQQVALLKTENVTISFTKDAIAELARLAMELNTSRENIGARRLHALVARVVTDISYSAPTHKGGPIVIDAKYINEKVADLLKSLDLRKYIL